VKLACTQMKYSASPPVVKSYSESNAVATGVPRVGLKVAVVRAGVGSVTLGNTRQIIPLSLLGRADEVIE
jgi:hypothetical protein